MGNEIADTVDETIKQIEEQTWEIQGSALLEDVAVKLGIPLDAEEFDTFSGYVLYEMGRIPEDGAEVDLDVPGLHIRAAKIVNHQVEKALVQLEVKEEK